MFKKLMILILLVLLAVGCTPEETEQTAELPPAKNTPEPAVNPVEEAVDNPVDEESAGPNGPEGELGEVINPDVTLVAPAGSVDLGTIPEGAATEEDGELIVQPAPGVPDPAVKMTQLAAEKLADQLGIDIGEITLIETISMEWPDAALGCPSPDLIYAAVLTPGYQITLEAEGQHYIFHTDMAETVILCVDGQPAE